MLYISTTLYCEAKPFIKYFKLKKTDKFHKFQVFLSDDIILIISGVGEIASSVAIACVCSTFVPKEKDFFLSFSSGAALSENMPLGELYLLNKITQITTDKTFYPDILFRHPFQEIQGITGSKILQEDSSFLQSYMQDETNLYLSYDMEAASSYVSASYFFETHQMLFLRVISDYGINKNTEKESQKIDISNNIMTYIECKKEILYPFVRKLMDREEEKSIPLNREAEAFLEEMTQILHLSVSMKNTLLQHVKFYLLMHENLSPILHWSSTNIPTTCKSKREGKNYFEELKRQLL